MKVVPVELHVLGVQVVAVGLPLLEHFTCVMICISSIWAGAQLSVASIRWRLLGMLYITMICACAYAIVFQCTMVQCTMVNVPPQNTTVFFNMVYHGNFGQLVSKTSIFN